MAKRHVQEYYDKICDDYRELLDNLKDMEEAANSGLVSPEQLQQLKDMIAPIKQNYMRISYIMYLFNMPNRKEKERPYQKRMKKFKDKLDNSDLQSIQEEDKQILDSMKF